MSRYDELDLPFLTKQDEEYQMLIDFAEEISKQKGGSTRHKSGKATMSVIRNHLVENHDFRIAELDAKIPKKGRMNLLFVLKNNTPTKPEYSPYDVDAVLKISNNAVGSSSYKTPSEPVRNKFEELKRLNENLRFAVVVLVENPEYENRFKEAFTCIYRDPRTPKILWDDVNLIEDLIKNNHLKKSRDWEKLIAYLRSK